jgi:tetrahydromethanopterin S-methyltransferase subunit B
MSQRDGFASGFFAGAIFGSVVGGVVGALAAQRRNGAEFAEDEAQQLGTIKSNSNSDSSGKRRQMGGTASSGVEMEMARRSLEDKIAQLNATIDEVRDQLGNVNNNSGAVNEFPSRSEELQS